MADEIQTMQPTIMSVDRELLLRALTVCEAGIANALECMHHNTGLTARTKKIVGDIYHQDFRRATQCRDQLRAALGWPEITQETGG